MPRPDPNAAVAHFEQADRWCHYNAESLNRFRHIYVPLTPSDCLATFAGAVHGSGISYRTLRVLWPRLEQAYRYFQPDDIALHRRAVTNAALRVINYPAKVNAVVKTAGLLADQPYDEFVDTYLVSPDAIGQLPFMGKALRYLMARNCGLPYAKPDVHLLRLADRFGYGRDVQTMCENIGSAVDEPVGYVDVVLFTYASQSRR